MRKNKERKIYRWLMHQLEPAQHWLLCSLLLGVTNGLLLLGQAAFLADIIHQLVVANASLLELQIKFIYTLLLILSRSLCVWGREFCGYRAGVCVRVNIREMILDKLRRLGPQVITGTPVGGWSAIVIEQVEALQEFVARYVPQMVLSVMTPLIMLLVVFPNSWVVGLIFLITAPLIPIFMIFVGSRAAIANRNNFQALSRLGGIFLDRIQGLEVLRFFLYTDQASLQISQASEEFRIKTMQVLRLAFISSAVLEFFASISIALVAVYIGMSFLGYITFGGEVSLYTGMFLLLLAPEFYQPLRDLGRYYHAKARAVGASEELFTLLHLEEPAEHHGHKSLAPKAGIILEVNNLTVSAASLVVNSTDRGSLNKTVLLDRVSFVVKPGARVGIIGRSGAGKSTLLNTLMGFLQFEGDIRMNGQSLAETNLNDWRRQIGWLGQYPQIIHGSVYDNISFGRNLSQQQCLEALDKAHGLDILKTKSGGLDGVLQELGGNISVGQAQRIALARALVVPVKILLLDEPAASLDLTNEKLVMKALAAIDRNTTIIMVTHRLNQLSAMDQVFMFEQGRLTFNGNSAQFLDNSAYYRRLLDS